MIVKLISYSPNPDIICATAGNLCHSKRPPTEIVNDKNYKNTLLKIIDMGHLSVLEHAIFTFSIEDVSRALTHQLVRHRIASFSQQSQRYVSIDEPKFITPNTIKGNNDAMEIYKKIMLSIWDAYKNLESIGIPIEDARYVLPNGCATNIIITMNARELLHFFSLRCCNRSQWEIREMANQMMKICQSVQPIIFKTAGAPCMRGPCPEGKLTCRNGNTKE